MQPPVLDEVCGLIGVQPRDAPAVSADERLASGTDPVLITTLIVLIGTGLAVLLSASYFHGQRVFGNPLYFFQRQLIWLALGLGAAWVAASTRLTGVRKLTPLLVGVALVLGLLTFVPGIGLEVLGARRWLYVGGMSFEPSELMKLALVLYLAHILDRRASADRPVAAAGPGVAGAASGGTGTGAGSDSGSGTGSGQLGSLTVAQTARTLLPPLLVVALFAGVVYLQNDFSTAFFLVFVAMAMLFIAGVRVLFFAGMGIIAAPLSVLLLLSREHRVYRLIAFFQPDADPAGSGYQILAARDALLRGGTWGAGIGRGDMKLGVIPEAHSDFIFAVAGGELGLIGVLLIIGLFVLFAWRGLRVARDHRQRYARYVAAGLTLAIFSQALLNMGVVAGLLPTTGLPLPFFSSGGSSLLVTLTMSGLLVGLTRAAREGRDD